MTPQGRDGERGGFDRIKTPEQRLLERPAGPRLDDPQADAGGRAALFTSGSEQAAERSRQRARQTSPADVEGGLLGLTVHCSRCDATAPVDAAAALRAVLPLALIAPWKRHQLFAVCPACGHRAWLRVATA